MLQIESGIGLWRNGEEEGEKGEVAGRGVTLKENIREMGERNREERGNVNVKKNMLKVRESGSMLYQYNYEE